ncbi:Protein RST1 [Quillaja saponaria]|uniref:Protein RST1 n=1 Tax=Quillaja saponaria TaxID=32244 RepID=A0AAD7M6D8_QUISA|nr:Protein RST1 [Quillaja saponaria]
MESYSPLLEKTRVPQPSLQKFAVISIFSKLRSAPKYLDSESEPGREAISQCLNSTFPAVVDQSVRELCRLVKDSHMDISRGMLELQSALEGTDPKFVVVFVKALGFLVRFGFQKNNGLWQFSSTETHPFVKVLSSRTEAHSELVTQVLLFMVQNKQLGMVEVCEFLRPLLYFSILRMPFSDSSSSSLAMQLISSMASFCCTFPFESFPVFKLLMRGLKYVPYSNSQEFRKLISFAEIMVDAYIVVIRLLSEKRSLVTEAQLCGIELLKTILPLLTCVHRHPGGNQPICELSNRLLSVQKDLGLRYIPALSSILLSLFVILVQSELEHEQLSILMLVLFVLKWKHENEYAIDRTKAAPVEELLFIFPAINLMSSPSKSIKGPAAELLVTLEKLLVKVLETWKDEPTLEEGVCYVSSPGSIVLRLLRHLWCQDQGSPSSHFILNFGSNSKSEGKMMHVPRSWTSQLREYCLSIVDRRKSSLPLSQSQESFVTEMPFLLSAVVGVLLMHPSLGATALDSLAALGVMDPKLGVPLLLTILFYSNIFTTKNVISCDMLLKLLGMLPSLASHSAMIPLIVQTILPMLNKDAKPTLYATATRLLCRTWEINDRAFGSLHGVLLPKGLVEFKTERNICISIAASVRDVCCKNPDRGVDLILSVSACIESQDPAVKALGFQSLAHLCEEDVIDFYTAWNVIAKHVGDYYTDPVLAHSICLLLRWGAMDAEAYAETSKGVLQILWGIVTYTHPSHELIWAKARTSALEALTQYEVPHLENNIPDFRKRNLELFFSETNPNVLRAMEDFQVKIIIYEHNTRRRLVKEKRVLRSKIEKLLDVFPQLIFSSGKPSEAGGLPGAALLCISFTPKNPNNLQASKRLRDVHAAYENALVEIAESLQLSRNIFVALITLQSWKSFMRRWMRADIFLFDAKAHSNVLDRTSKAATDILKSMIMKAEEAIPRSAENIALAIGALCLVLPPSAHTIKSAASKFLLDWLLQHEHEHRQWSAAISLGLISSYLHVTDHKLRYQNITALLEVLGGSKSALVKGACGVGLGFACQDLLTRVEAAENSDLEKGKDNVPEAELLGGIVRALSMAICQLTQSSSDILESLCSFSLLHTYETNTSKMSELSYKDCDYLEEDIWGVAGLVFGLASSTSAIYRAGEQEAVLKIKSLFVSWIPHVNALVQSTGAVDESERLLSVGSCIATPIVVAFCQRVELMDDIELEKLVYGYKELISELTSIKKSDILHQSLLMASCIGAGTLLGCILNEGVLSIEVECVKGLLELFRKCYSNPYPPLIHLGGMFGVVNATGAGAGILVDMHLPSSTMQHGYEQKESSYVRGPLLSSSVFQLHLTSLVQEMFLVAQNSDDHQLQHYASWAVSFLRHRIWSNELPIVDNDTNADKANLKSVSQSFAEDNVVMKLSSWLMSLNCTGMSTIAHVETVATVLRCLSRAPRLPSLDWGAVIRRCMKYETQVAKLLPSDSVHKKGTLRVECVQFSLAHAPQFDPLLTFLDELSDLSRFRTLELNLQSCLLIHLSDLMKVYSGSRLEKLFDDVINHLFSVTQFQVCEASQKSLLRVSCWKGLNQSLDEISIDRLDCISHVERCMEALFTLLPTLESSASEVVSQVNSVEEWSEAVKCLEKAPRRWLLDFLQEDPLQRGGWFIEVQKKVHVKVKLVKTGSLPLIELGKLKSDILNSKLQGIWDILIEFVAALQHAEGVVKRQWLVDAVEISCVSRYPSTALQFLGLLSSTCCKYMPILILDQQTVLSDLPVTLTSLLSDSSWEVVAETVSSHLYSSTERIYNWATQTACGNYMPGMQPIDKSEENMAAFLLQVLHHTCVLLKSYLSLDKQLRLTNMVVD